MAKKLGAGPLTRSASPRLDALAAQIAERRSLAGSAASSLNPSVFRRTPSADTPLSGLKVQLSGLKVQLSGLKVQR